MGNTIYLNFGENVSHNKLDLGKTRQGKKVGFWKHDYKPSNYSKAGNLDVDR